MSESRLIVGYRRGRGAVSNTTGRYEGYERVALDDGWNNLDEEPPQLRTTVTRDSSRSIIATNDSPDIPFDQSINPYRGCEHGCVYCYARPTHAYLGLSPGQDFESRLFAKPDADRLLADALARPAYRCKLIALGTNTDPYQPVEDRMEITRSLLGVLAEHDHPVEIVTKSQRVVRDIDLLAPMAEKGLARVNLSVTTLDRKLARGLEPRAATPARRLDAVRVLADAGIPVGVMVAPIIPALTDFEIETILDAAAEAGATLAGYVLLRLPREVKDLFSEWLKVNAPMKAEHVLSLVRGARGGQLNDADFGKRMRGSGPYAELIAQRFRLATRRLGLANERPPLRTDLFHRPARAGDQLDLL